MIWLLKARDQPFSAFNTLGDYLSKSVSGISDSRSVTDDQTQQNQKAFLCYTHLNVDRVCHWQPPPRKKEHISITVKRRTEGAMGQRAFLPLRASRSGLQKRILLLAIHVYLSYECGRTL